MTPCTVNHDAVKQDERTFRASCIVIGIVRGGVHGELLLANCPACKSTLGFLLPLQEAVEAA